MPTSRAPQRPARGPGLTIETDTVVDGKFRVESLIAHGGMGSVYRARQVPEGRVVALKLLRAWPGQAPADFLARSRNEAAVGLKLHHPNTITVFEHGFATHGPEREPVPYLAMELLEGRTLHTALRADGPFGVDRALRVGRQVCRSLREAHRLGIVHHDLKPANIFLIDEEDFVKVIDFGLAAGRGITKNLDEIAGGSFVGSPKYMAPEQIRGDSADGRADLYSLAVILFEMLAGKPPFDYSSTEQILTAHLNEVPMTVTEASPTAYVPAELEAIVRRCLQKEPDRRIADAQQLLDALKRVTRDLGLASGSIEQSSSGEHSHERLVSTPAPPPHPSRTTADSVEPPRLSTLRVKDRSQWLRPLLWATLVFLAGATVSALGFTLSAGGFRPAVIHVSSQPPGAHVWVGGEDRGTTPAQVPVEGAGEPLRIRLTLDGYDDVIVEEPVESSTRIHATLRPRNP